MRLRLPQKQPWRPIFLFSLPLVMLVTVLTTSTYLKANGQQFYDLAQGMAHGHLYMWHTHYGLSYDPVPYHGHQYWSEGVLPAVILLPFVSVANLFHAAFYQQYLTWLFVLGVWYFVFKLAQHFRYSVEDSLLLMFAFAIGSAFIGASAVSSSWLYAQVITTFLLFWGLYEYFTRQRKRWWVFGIICAMIFLTRVTATPIIIFFALELWQSGRRLRPVRYLQLVIPLVVAAGLQMLYNFLRFHNPMNGGYEYQLLDIAPAESRSLGIFSIRHIPTNLYFSLLGSPVVVTRTVTSWTLTYPFIEGNNNGMSIFLTSPYLLSLFSRKRTSFNKTAVNLLIAASISFLGVLCFYGLGRNQLGYRYSLDFLPELFVVFMITYRAEHKRLSRAMKLLILLGGVFNFYLLLNWL